MVDLDLLRWMPGLADLDLLHGGTEMAGLGDYFCLSGSSFWFYLGGLDWLVRTCFTAGLN